MTDTTVVGFWKTVFLLLKASRRRSDGRRDRQRQLLNNRGGTDWGPLAVIFAFLVMALIHGAAAYAVESAVSAGQRVALEQRGKLVVSDDFLRTVSVVVGARKTGVSLEDDDLETAYADEAKRISDNEGGRPNEIEQKLRATIAASGDRNLISRDNAEPGIGALARSGPASAILGSLVLLWWFAMTVCQGEGLELDLQRRRHPMWEWLLSHPVTARAVFFAEMLSPLAANPTYWAAPLFLGVLYGMSYDASTGLCAFFLIGIPFAFAAACVSKAVEVGAVLRLPSRSRGAVIGIVSWFGYASMIAMFFGAWIMSHAAGLLARWLDFQGLASWSVLGLVLGLDPDGNFVFLRGLLFCWAAVAMIIAAAVLFSGGSVRKGLSGSFAEDAPRARRAEKVTFGREPLFRKEYLWFVRDRSAIVQTILIPVTVAGVQLFNFRRVLEHAEDSWNYLSGAAIFFGTYFLWVLGPKSLTSEGSALWIALTWPRGLESVLKAKAWLWAMISSGLVAVILLVACWMFPHEIWKIALVGAGWYLFARSMAEKSVTLVTVVSESGEPRTVSNGRRWAAQLGMLSFAIGICTEQWNLAIVGIVYSWITAAAMWENLRARLPYLYDPWSEALPAPPTLMHAMVSITILLECASLLTGIFFAIGGRNSLAVAQAVGYAICAAGVSIGVSAFLSGRGVLPASIWCWRDGEPDPDEQTSWFRRYLADDRQALMWLACGVGVGALLGLVAHCYLITIQLIPLAAEMMRVANSQMDSIPNMATAYAVMAIGVAPFAEEYLFRGLVYRQLDRQWGGWRAVLGAAAFFAIYHPPLAWLPVFLVGAANCLLFRQSRRLAPAILLHMTYNAVVTLWS